MANKENVDVNIDVNGADAIENDLKGISKQAESTSDEFGTMDSNAKKAWNSIKDLGSKGGRSLKGLGQVGSKAFKAIGTAIKATGIGLLIGLLGTLWEALKRNQVVMDLFETAVNAVSIVIRPVAEGIGELVEGLTSGSEKFDAFGKVIKNVMSIALKPLQFTFNTLKLGILELQIAWEKLSAALSKKKELDEGKVAELKSEVEATKERMKELAQQTGQSFTEIRDNTAEAFQEMKDFGKSVVDGIKDAVVEVQNGAARAATEAKKNMQSLVLEQERLKVTYQNAAELQRQIRDDESKTFEERIEANRELGLILAKQAQSEVAAVNAKIEAQQAILALDKSNIEAQNELYSLNTQLLEIEERINGQRSEQLVNINSLNREKEALAREDIERARSVAEEIRRIEQESAISRLEDANEQAILKAEFEQENFELELEKRLANEEITQEELLKLKKTYGEQTALIIADINNKIEEEDKESAKARIEIEKAVAQAKIDGALTAANALLGAADAVFGETKASAIAQTVITTYQSATSAFSALAGIPVVGPVLGGIAAAAAIAAGIANINKIRQEDKPKSEQPKKIIVPNQNPTFAYGGEIHGPSHTRGGVDINVEGGEYIVNKSSMSGPSGAIVRDINKNGVPQYATLEQVAAMINAQEIYIVESKMTSKQKEAKVRQSRLVSG